MTTDAILHDYYPRLLLPRYFGYPLYNPDCESNDRTIDIGSVGVVREGRFHVIPEPPTADMSPYTTYTELRDVKTGI